MKEKAIEKINTEMQKNPSDPYTEIIGQYIIDRAGASEEVAAKVVPATKSLKGAMNAVMTKAQAAKHGNVAVLTPATVFGAVDAYFGIPTDTAAQWKAINAAGAPAPAPEPKPTGPKKLDLDFDAFL